MTHETLEQKRAKIKYWLNLHGVSRQEVAEKLGVHLTSLNGWLSNKSIPEKRWQEISDIFETPKEPEEPRNRILGSNFSDSEVEKIKLAANGIQLEEYIRELVLRQIRQDLRLDD